MGGLPVNNRISISIKNMRSVWPHALIKGGTVLAELLEAETNNQVMAPTSVPYTGIPGRFEASFHVALVPDNEYKLIIKYFDTSGQLVATWVSYIRAEERAAVVGA